MYIGFQVRVKYSLFLSDYNKDWIFSTVFKYQISRKSVQ